MPSYTPNDIYFYYFENTYSEGNLLTLLKKIKGKCKEGFSQEFSCNIGNLSTLPESGLIIGYATESAIPTGTLIIHEFLKLINGKPFINMTEGFNKSVHYDFIGKFYHFPKKYLNCFPKGEVEKII